MKRRKQEFHEYIKTKLAGDYAVELHRLLNKIKPRHIVLENTGETRRPSEGEYVFNNGNLCLCRKPERWGNEHEIWREVKE